MTIEIIEFLQSFRNVFFDGFFSFISFLGEEYVYITVFAVVYYAIDKKMGEFLAFALFTTAGINTVIKGIVSAPRPFEKYPNRVENLRPDTATGHSFPSGHTQNFTTFAFVAGFYKQDNRILIGAGILSILMAMSRMYLGVHFFEDVTVSLVLGVVLAYVLSKVYNKYSGTKQLEYIYYGIIVFLTPFLFFITNKDFYTSYGLLLGFSLAMSFEKRFVNFTISSKISHKIIRVILGLIVMMGLQIGLKPVFGLLHASEMLQIVLDLIRYMLVAFVGLGVFPIVFNKLKI